MRKLHGASTSIDGWYSCLRCFRFFTKHVDELFCYDCTRLEKR